MAAINGACLITISSFCCSARYRGSECNSPALAGGTELSASQRRKQRRPGSALSRLMVSVVPVRGRPNTKSGRSIGRSSNSGCSLRYSTMRSRLASVLTMLASQRCAPASDRLASSFEAVTSRDNPSRTLGSPTSVSPVAARAFAMISSKFMKCPRNPDAPFGSIAETRRYVRFP
jgi:hypothetical protein